MPDHDHRHADSTRIHIDWPQFDRFIDVIESFSDNLSFLVAQSRSDQEIIDSLTTEVKQSRVTLETVVRQFNKETNDAREL